MLIFPAEDLAQVEAGRLNLVSENRESGDREGFGGGTRLSPCLAQEWGASRLAMSSLV